MKGAWRFDEPRDAPRAGEPPERAHAEEDPVAGGGQVEVVGEVDDDGGDGGDAAQLEQDDERAGRAQDRVGPGDPGALAEVVPPPGGVRLLGVGLLDLDRAHQGACDQERRGVDHEGRRRREGGERAPDRRPDQVVRHQLGGLQLPVGLLEAVVVDDVGEQRRAGRVGQRLAAAEEEGGAHEDPDGGGVEQDHGGEAGHHHEPEGVGGHDERDPPPSVGEGAGGQAEDGEGHGAGRSHDGHRGRRPVEAGGDERESGVAHAVAEVRRPRSRPQPLEGRGEPRFDPQVRSHLPAYSHSPGAGPGTVRTGWFADPRGRGRDSATPAKNPSEDSHDHRDHRRPRAARGRPWQR